MDASGLLATFGLDDGNRQVDVSELDSEYKIPPPKYRHAAPSAPWPWMEFDQDEAEVKQLPPSTQEDWGRYPTSHFANWTARQVERCGIETICRGDECKIYKVDVFDDGKFDKPERDTPPQKIRSEPDEARKYWDELHAQPEPNLRVRALFIENITLTVLKILGATYEIEPFFFASSANWIPAQYQENPQPRKGDHITVVLPFIRVIDNHDLALTPLDSMVNPPEKVHLTLTDIKQTIDTQAPLVLDEKILLQDLLAIHMIRNTGTDVIISYHHHHHARLVEATAKRLQSLVQRTGDSVYWQKIYEKSKDSTFVFLAILWYALCEWDKALEDFYAHLSKQLEATQGENPGQDPKLTRELHKLQAHLSYYQQLLQNFQKSVEFVRDTPNPTMDVEGISDEDRKISKRLMDLETKNLLSEIKRLLKQMDIESDRLRNGMQLVYVLATLRDSAAMKLISYLTIIFLPANLLASVFQMNSQINPGGTKETLTVYIWTTSLLTVTTAWVAVGLQQHSSFHRGGYHYMERIFWPVMCIYYLVTWMVAQAKRMLTPRRKRPDAKV